ncbi:MAG TPA: GIY-YIG nuclease family protein [Candidatus Paceibacterota bacterium]
MLSQTDKIQRKVINLFTKANLPDSPGVYFFKDYKGVILYIGRATSLYDRVKSYFSDDLMQTRGFLIVDMITKVKIVDYKKTDSVLEAIILENNLIKKYQPYFNTKEKDNKSYNYIVITDEDSPRVIIVRERVLAMTNGNHDISNKKFSRKSMRFKIKEKFGPYPNASLLKEALCIIRKIFPFRDAKALIPSQEKFYRSIGLSPNINSLESEKEYKKTIQNLTLFFQGKKSKLMNTLEREMKIYAVRQEFEKADKVKKTIYALTHIQDIALIKTGQDSSKSESQKGFRIEAYDIAHMSGRNTVGVMVVSCDGELDKSEYRKFKISRESNDDVGNLKEILVRRFGHMEWQMPNFIVVDGGLAQKNSAKEIINQLFKRKDNTTNISKDIHIPIIAVVKDDTHKAKHFLGDQDIIKKHENDILKINDEAHRFAIAYHRNLRKKTFLKS